jgi:hypothetical protein
MPSNRAILIDIETKNLNPRRAYTVCDANGGLANVTQAQIVAKPSVVEPVAEVATVVEPHAPASLDVEALFADDTPAVPVIEAPVEEAPKKRNKRGRDISSAE